MYMPGSMVTAMPGISSRVSCVSQPSRLTAFPWTLPAQAVAQPVAEVAPEARRLDEVPRGPVHLPALQGAALPERGLDLPQRQVPCAGHRVEDGLVALRRRVAGERGPRDVREHRVRPRQLAPQVYQHPVAMPDGGSRVRRGLEVGIG